VCHCDTKSKIVLLLISQYREIEKWFFFVPMFQYIAVFSKLTFVSMLSEIHL